MDGPTPEEVKQTRTDAGLTQIEAAKLIHCSLGAWQKWEGGSRRMHQAFFELFQIKINPCQKQFNVAKRETTLLRDATKEIIRLRMLHEIISLEKMSVVSAAQLNEKMGLIYEQTK